MLPIYLYNKHYLPKLRKRYKTEAMALCTGWATTQKFAVKSFALSSHADHKNIRQYFTESGAKELIFF